MGDMLTPEQMQDVVLHGDALEVLATLPNACVDAIVTDPPYFRVKGEAWDRQWDNRASFLAWIERLCVEWRRVLRPNGSIYVFASPQMAAHVEVVMWRYFTVVNNIIWVKPNPDGGINHGAGNGGRVHKESLRAYYPRTERIIFAEHYGADSMALGESGYAAQCEKLHGFVFEPLRAYLDGERRRAGIRKEDCNAACGFTRIAGGMASRHYFGASQWALPTELHYAALQRLAPGYFSRSYETLRREYETLRREYETLRRPFAVTADVSYTDVWTFATVSPRPNKHPCEKPLDLCRHIIRTSTRPGALILDSFVGGGAILDAAKREGRRYLGSELDATWVTSARHRLAATSSAPAIMPMLPSPSPIPAKPTPMSLWDWQEAS